MASIYSKKGILYLKYYEEDEYGQRRNVQYSLHLKDTRENRKLARKIKTELEGELIKPNYRYLQHTITLSHAIKLFMKSKESTSKSTKRLYRTMFTHLTDVIPVKTTVNKIKKEDILRFEKYLREDLGLKQNSIASYFRHLKAFWNWLVSEKYYAENIVKRIKTEDKPIVIIPDHDLERILNYLHGKNMNQYRFVKFLQLTGMRIGEATELRWEWVNFDRRRIVLKNIKGKRVEEFPLYPKLWQFMNSFKKNSGVIFNYKNTDSLKFWRRAMNKLNMDYKMHSIRKTFATKLVDKNISIFDAMKLLRHRKVSTTIKYYTAVDLERIGNEVNNVYEIGELKRNENQEKERMKNNNDTKIYNIK